MSKYRWSKSFFNNISSGDGYLDQLCWICAASLSEPLPIVFYSVANYRPNLGREGRKKEKLRTRAAIGLTFPTNYVKNIFGILSGGRYLAQTDIRWLLLSPSTTFQNAMPPQDANSPWDHFGYGFATPNRSVLNTILSLSSYKLKACFCFYSQWRVSWWCRWTNTSP